MDSKSIIWKYFHEVLEIYLIDEIFGDYSSEYIKESEINGAELAEILEEYNLSNWFNLFSELSVILINSSWLIEHHKELNKTRKEHNEEIQIINASRALNNKNVSSVKIIVSNSKGKQSFILKELDIINELGKVLFQEYYIKPVKEGVPQRLLLTSIRQINPRSRKFQALVSFSLKDLLENETELKAGGSHVSNQQAKFIYDFLEFSGFLGIDTSKVLKEEYIRTLMSNYKGKIKSIRFISI